MEKLNPFIQPFEYTRYEGDFFEYWPPVLRLTPADLDKRANPDAFDPAIIAECGTRIHSLIFQLPNGKSLRWDCINGFTD